MTVTASSAVSTTRRIARSFSVIFWSCIITPLIQAMRPLQYSRPTSTTGKGRIFSVWMSVIASNSSSSVPKPPGRITKPEAYLTNIILRTKK